MGRAIVVICPHRPDVIFGQPLLGHVAWGYEYPNGEWCIGAIEGDGWRGGINGFWSVKMPNLNAALRYFSNMKNHGAEYDYYKLLTVSAGAKENWRYADQMVNWVSKQKYELIGRNCMNSTYDILRAFSNGKYNGTDLPHPATNWIPNGWFNAIKTNEYYNLPSSSNSRSLSRSQVEKVEDFVFEGDEIQTPEWRLVDGELFIGSAVDNSKLEAAVVSPPKDLQKES